MIPERLSVYYFREKNARQYENASKKEKDKKTNQKENQNGDFYDEFFLMSFFFKDFFSCVSPE